MDRLPRTPPALHPVSLSPDPSVGRSVRRTDNAEALDVFPHRLIRGEPQQPALARWGTQLAQARHVPVTLRPDARGRIDLLIDFGTEVDGVFELEVTTSALANAMFFFGEVVPEAEGLVFGHYPDQRICWHIPGTGRHRHTVGPRGFRFVRIVLMDVKKSITIDRIATHCELTFTKRAGNFRCDDRRFQRVWETSLYTARLCTKPDTIWDGVKRDRHGWYGDARITKITCDQVYFDPRPAEAMLLALPTGQWANTIPTYSFDAISMLKQHILTYGLGRRCIRGVYARIKQLLAWVRRTQTDSAGFIKRTNRHYFGGTGFIDWSLMPQGGRMEELCCLQAKYVEASRDAAMIAGWLGQADDARRWSSQAAALRQKVIRRFWRSGVGFIHTLNHVGPVPNPYLPGHTIKQHEMTYKQGIRLGPSGPTRQANALAVWAGLADPAKQRTILSGVFDSPKIPTVITPYFAYYEQSARAMCGDPAGAVQHMRDYIGQILETEDAATVWEVWDPALSDHRRHSSSRDLNWEWPHSACHAWGSGAVGITSRFLLGINPVEPGYRAITLRPATAIPWALEATVPTPLGKIEVRRDRCRGPVHARLPKAIELKQADTDGQIRIERY